MAYEIQIHQNLNCRKTYLVLILHVSLLHSVCLNPPMWCHLEVSEDPEQSSTPFHRHQDTLDRWTLGLLLQWRWCSVENRQRCRLIQGKASQEDPHWCWYHGELQTGNQVSLHQGSHPDNYEIGGSFHKSAHPRTVWSSHMSESHFQMKRAIFPNLTFKPIWSGI